MSRDNLLMGRKLIRFVMVQHRVVQLELSPFLTDAQTADFPRNWFADEHLTEVEALLQPCFVWLITCDRQRKKKELKYAFQDCLVGSLVRLGFNIKKKPETQSLLTRTSKGGVYSCPVFWLKLVVYVCPRRHSSSGKANLAFSQLVTGERQTPDQHQISSYFLRHQEKQPVLKRQEKQVVSYDQRRTCSNFTLTTAANTTTFTSTATTATTAISTSVAAASSSIPFACRPATSVCTDIATTVCGTFATTATASCDFSDNIILSSFASDPKLQDNSCSASKSCTENHCISLPSDMPISASNAANSLPQEGEVAPALDSKNSERLFHKAGGQVREVAVERKVSSLQNMNQKGVKTCNGGKPGSHSSKKVAKVSLPACNSISSSSSKLITLPEDCQLPEARPPKVRRKEVSPASTCVSKTVWENGSINTSSSSSPSSSPPSQSSSQKHQSQKKPSPSSPQSSSKNKASVKTSPSSSSSSPKCLSVKTSLSLSVSPSSLSSPQSSSDSQLASKNKPKSGAGKKARLNVCLTFKSLFGDPVLVRSVTNGKEKSFGPKMAGCQTPLSALTKRTENDKGKTTSSSQKTTTESAHGASHSGYLARSAPHVRRGSMEVTSVCSSTTHKIEVTGRVPIRCSSLDLDDDDSLPDLSYSGGFHMAEKKSSCPVKVGTQRSSQHSPTTEPPTKNSDKKAASPEQRSTKSNPLTHAAGGTVNSTAACMHKGVKRPSPSKHKPTSSPASSPQCPPQKKLKSSHIVKATDNLASCVKKRVSASGFFDDDSLPDLIGSAYQREGPIASVASAQQSPEQFSVAVPVSKCKDKSGNKSSTSQQKSAAKSDKPRGKSRSPQNSSSSSQEATRTEADGKRKSPTGKQTLRAGKRRSSASPPSGCADDSCKRQKKTDAKSSLTAAHKSGVLNLSDEELERHVLLIRDELMAVYKGEVNTSRLQQYMEGGNRRRQLDHQVRLQHFREGQEDVVMDVLLGIFSQTRSTQSQLKNLDFLMRVMLPEALSRVYKNITGFSWDDEP